MLGLLGLIATIGLLAGLRWAIHRSRASERVTGARTPADIGFQFQDVTIPTEYGKSILGWPIPENRPGSGPAVVALHGWGGNAENLLALVRPLHEAGFTLLLIDARCCGRSDQDGFASMPRFAEDFSHAIDWLKCRDDIDSQATAAIGHSVGARAALLSASRRNDIAAVVSIAAFTHPVAMMRRWFASKDIPYQPIGWLMLRYVEWVIGHRFDDIAPVNTIRQVRCSVLLVHGAEDTTVPISTSPRPKHAFRWTTGRLDEQANLTREYQASCGGNSFRAWRRADRN